MLRIRNITYRFDPNDSSTAIARDGMRRPTSRQTIRNATVYDGCVDRLRQCRCTTCNCADAHSEFGITDVWQSYVREAVDRAVFGPQDRPCGCDGGAWFAGHLGPCCGRFGEVAGTVQPLPGSAVTATSAIEAGCCPPL